MFFYCNDWIFKVTALVDDWARLTGDNLSYPQLFKDRWFRLGSNSGRRSDSLRSYRVGHDGPWFSICLFGGNYTLFSFLKIFEIGIIILLGFLPNFTFRNFNFKCRRGRDYVLFFHAKFHVFNLPRSRFSLCTLVAAAEGWKFRIDAKSQWLV